MKKWAFRFDQTEHKLLGALRTWVRILFIMGHEFSETNINVRAAALTYSIVLALVPMLAMSTAVLKGLGSDNQLKVVAYRFIDQLEPSSSNEEKINQEERQKTPSSPGLGEKAKTEVPTNDDFSQQEKSGQDTESEKQQSLAAHLRNAVDTIFEYVDRTNFAALGAFGIFGLLIAVVFVLGTIEKAMNDIWHTAQGRSIFRKLMDYQALLILLPISINIALAGDAMLESPKMMSYLTTIIPSTWMVKMLLNLLPFLFIILTLMLMYQFFPNVRVKTHAAFAGALFAGFFWFAVQKAYILLQIGVAKYNAIYGSFATVPLFLIWIYLGWTFILLGATLAYAVQNRHQFHLPGLLNSPQRELQVAFDVLNTVYTNFAAKKPTSLDDLAAAIVWDLPGDIQKIVERLVDGGLLYRTENNDSNYVPVAPAENMEARDVVRLFLGKEKIPSLGGQFSSQIIQAAEEAIPAEAFPLIGHVDTITQTSEQRINDEKTS